MVWKVLFFFFFFFFQRGVKSFDFQEPIRDIFFHERAAPVDRHSDTKIEAEKPGNIANREEEGGGGGAVHVQRLGV